MPGDHLPVKWRVQAHFSGQLGIERAGGEGLVAARVRCGIWRSKCTVSSGGEGRGDFTLSSPMRKIHQAPFTCSEPDGELINPSWMLLDLVMSKKNAADIRI